MTGRSRRERFKSAVVALSGLVVGLLCFAASALGAQDANRLLAVRMEAGAAAPTVLFETAQPVDYRYTAYVLQDPFRVVVDFPGMSAGTLAGKLPAAPAPLKEIRIANFELAAGAMARVEIVLDATAEYKVVTDAGQFRIVFPSLSAPAKSEQKSPVTGVSPAAKGGVLRKLEFSAGRALLVTDGEVGRFESFTLESPPRLVVDLYDFSPAFEQRVFETSAGMRRVSVSAHSGKTRFTFEAEGKAVSEHVVAKEAGGLAVSWSKSASPAATADVPAAASGRQVVVEAVDFKNRDGRSVIEVALSAPARVSQPVQDGNLIRFDIQNATISRALRRPIDTSAFPSAVTVITPSAPGGSLVRVAVEVKGPVPFVMADDGNLVKLVIEDGAYAKVEPGFDGKRPVVVHDNAGDAAASEYSGEKVTLVFDQADIRDILQLIGEASNMNMVAGPEVKGEINLRLIDVPWEQALKIIVDTMHFKTLTDGNVIKVYTIKSYAEAQQIEKDAKISDTKASDEIKIRKVIQVNYVNMDSIATMAKVYDGVVCSVDKNTKKVILSGSVTKVESLALVIEEIDVPDRQVSIEARVVEASTDFTKRLGVKWAADYDDSSDPGSQNGNITGGALGLGGEFLRPLPIDGIAAAGLASGITFGALDGDLTINMRISALQESGEGKVVSTPRVTTLNGQTATISQGTQIPYPTTSDDGNTAVSFQDALLQLKVTPEINQDGSIILDLEVSNDTVGKVYQTSNGETPSIEKKNAKAKVLVKNGETIVIGGIYVTSALEAHSGVPYLMDIPYVGWLFSSKTARDEQRELLVFITPRMIVAD